MYLQIKRIEPQPSKYGNDFKISMIGLYQDDGKWIKWIKLDTHIMEFLKDAKIPFMK